MHDLEGVAIFWDYENCPVPSNTSGYSIVDNIRSLARPYGSVKSFRAYLEISDQVQKPLVLRSELQSSGVSLVDCPHNGRKDVGDKMIIVDMFTHAIDTSAPSTVVLITGDRDFAYAVSTLRLRRYRVILVALSNAHASLKVQASICLDWANHVLTPTEVPVKASKHLKQGSLLDLQENPQSSHTQDSRGEWVEVRRDEETSLLQMTRNATDSGLAPQLPLQSNPTESPGQRSLGSKEQPTSSDSIPILPSEKAKSRLSPTLEPTSMAKSVVESKVITETSDPNQDLSSKSQSIPSITDVKEQPFSLVDVTDENKPQPDDIRDHEDLFAQPLLSQIVLPDQSFSAQPVSALAPTMFLPSILTGSSSRARISVPSKPPTEPLRPLLVPSLDISSTDYNGPNALSLSASESLTTTIVSKPTLALPIMVTMPPKVLSPITLPSSSVEAMPLQPPAISNSNSFAYSVTKCTDDGSQTPYTASALNPAVLSRPVADGSMSNSGGGPAQSTPLHSSICPALTTSDTEEVEDISASTVAKELPLDSPSDTGSVLSHLPRRLSMPNLTALASSSSSGDESPSDDSESICSVPTSTSLFQIADAVANSNSGHDVHPVSLPESPPSAPDALAIPVPLPLHEPAIVPPTPSPSFVEVVPEIFKPLVQCLQAHRSRYTLQPFRTDVAMELEKDITTFARAGVTSFEEYTALAKQRGVIELGGKEKEAWIRLRPNWYNATSSSATDFSSSSVMSAVHPTSDTSDSLASRSIVSDSLLELIAGVIKSTPSSKPVLSAHSSPFAAFLGSPLPQSVSTPISPMPVQSPIVSSTPVNSYSAIVKGTSSTNFAPILPTLPLPAILRTPVTVPDIFKVLVKCLQDYRSKGILKPPRTDVAMELNKNKATYTKAAVAKFGAYTALAEAQGIIELGLVEPRGKGAWIALKPQWYHAVAS